MNQGTKAAQEALKKMSSGGGGGGPSSGVLKALATTVIGISGVATLGYNSIYDGKEEILCEICSKFSIAHVIYIC